MWSAQERLYVWEKDSCDGGRILDTNSYGDCEFMISLDLIKGRLQVGNYAWVPTQPFGKVLLELLAPFTC